jgi:hypothetical protein
MCGQQTAKGDRAKVTQLVQKGLLAIRNHKTRQRAGNENETQPARQDNRRNEGEDEESASDPDNEAPDNTASNREAAAGPQARPPKFQRRKNRDLPPPVHSSQKDSNDTTDSGSNGFAQSTAPGIQDPMAALSLTARQNRKGSAANKRGDDQASGHSKEKSKTGHSEKSRPGPSGEGSQHKRRRSANSAESDDDRPGSTSPRNAVTMNADQHVSKGKEKIRRSQSVKRVKQEPNIDPESLDYMSSKPDAPWEGGPEATGPGSAAEPFTLTDEDSDADDPGMSDRSHSIQSSEKKSAATKAHPPSQRRSTSEHSSTETSSKRRWNAVPFRQTAKPTVQPARKAFTGWNPVDQASSSKNPSKQRVPSGKLHVRAAPYPNDRLGAGQVIREISVTSSEADRNRGYSKDEIAQAPSSRASWTRQMTRINDRAG